MMVLTMDFINHVIEESKFNSILINGSKYTYVRKFAPHLTLRWSKREMLLDKINYKNKTLTSNDRIKGEI